MDQDVRIVVLQRGWVLVGLYWRSGEYCGISSGACVRRWGTTEGLGQLASSGPLDGTKLDEEPEGSSWHALAEIRTLTCRPGPWAAEIKKWERSRSVENSHE